MNPKTVILITGPTASGKTSLAIDCAKKFGTAIISADSRQCFRELNIGVAKPSPAELAAVKHYFINSHSITESVNAATFEKEALLAAEEIFLQHNVAILAGGTGLYIQAFCNGLDPMPFIPGDIRREIISGYEKHGLEWLKEQLSQSDPLYQEGGDLQNPQRMMRALEIVKVTGTSIKRWQQKGTASRYFNIIKLGISISKEDLHANINDRTEQMMQQGLLKEVTALVPYRKLNALQTVGYTELFGYIDGEYTLQQATERIKMNTRRYAKRQMTWFRKDADIQWGSLHELKEYIGSIRI